MALTYKQANAAANDPQLLQQVATAMLAYALTVYAEASTTADDTNRRVMAFAVLRNPAPLAQRFVLALLAQNAATLTLNADNTTITVSDATLLNAVTAVWNAEADAGL